MSTILAALLQAPDQEQAAHAYVENLLNVLRRNPLAVLLFVCFLIVGLLYHFAKPRHSA